MSTAVTKLVRDDGYVTYTWAALAAGETGDAADIGRYPGIKTFQLTGTFNTETVAIEGSMDGTTFAALHALDYDTGDYASLAAVAAAALSAIVENPLFIRPVVTSGSGVTLKLVIGCKG